jgi:hypothetical protein
MLCRPSPISGLNFNPERTIAQQGLQLLYFNKLFVQPVALRSKYHVDLALQFFLVE